jgi:HD-GYP domain-containing protein (c-di-GMP phosphodiesterase class II)/DNA-binding CsgD family transcriptional regulator
MLALSSRDGRGMLSERVRLADLLAAVSVATDLGMGQEPEKAIRACLVATALARRMGTPEADVSQVYYTALLRHLGCTATAHEEAYVGGDELASRPAAERADFGNPRETVALLLQMGKGTGVDRVRYLARALRAGRKGDQAILTAVCEVGALLAERLHLGAGVRDGLYQAFERWDGKGTPQGLAAEGICLPARLAEVGHQAVIFDRLGDLELAVAVIRRRAGGWFDPGVVETFARFGGEILDEVGSRDVWEAVLEAEPAPRQTIGRESLDGLARALADMVDLKSPYLLGHSSEVAALSERAAVALGFGPEAVTDLRRAALLHDLGRLAVSNRIWEKPAALSTIQWERVRLHPYQTERILARSRVLEPLARTAGMHHERQDGSGYHRGASGAQVPAAARVLAAADALQAMTQDRSYRPGLAPAAASAALAEQARSGRLDPECVRAVIEAAGQPAPKVRTTWPAGLSDREVEVLRLVARGLSNRAIAGRLHISPRTAEHHVQHIYTKIGGSTRAAAAMFAMEHGLLRN